MVLGQVSSPNVWMDSVQDDVTDISDTVVAVQSINENSVTLCQVSAPNVWIDSVHHEFCSDSFTWCQVRLGQVSSPNVWRDSVHDDVTDITNALVAAQSVTNALLHGVWLGQVSAHMFGLNSVHNEFCSGSFRWCQVRLGQFAKCFEGFCSE